MEWEQLLTNWQEEDFYEREDHGRNHIVRDFDRLIFCQPFRLLQNKTQVHPLPVNGFIHSRLTHSLEVSSVGRSLGYLAGEQLQQRCAFALAKEGKLATLFADTLRAACLAHDIGNPPFGHAGEEAFREFFTQLFQESKIFQEDEIWQEGNGRYDFCNFEGNAQGFRIINRAQGMGKLSPLTQLTFTKYPRAAATPNYKIAADNQRCDQLKAGFYSSELDIFRELAQESKLLSLSDDTSAFVRYPLAWLLEAADDICYRILDIEDGVNLGYIPLLKGKELFAQLTRFDTGNSLAELRSQAIKKLIKLVIEAFFSLEKNILNGQLERPLLEHVDPQTEKILKEINEISKKRLYEHPQVLENVIAGQKVLKSVLNRLTEVFLQPETRYSKAWIRLLNFYPGNQEPQWFRPKAKGKPYHWLCYIRDFTAGLSDGGVIELWRKMEGWNLS